MALSNIFREPRRELTEQGYCPKWRGSVPSHERKCPKWFRSLLRWDWKVLRFVNLQKCIHKYALIAGSLLICQLTGGVVFSADINEFGIAHQKKISPRSSGEAEWVVIEKAGFEKSKHSFVGNSVCLFERKGQLSFASNTFGIFRPRTDDPFSYRECLAMGAAILEWRESWARISLALNNQASIGYVNDGGLFSNVFDMNLDNWLHELNSHVAQCCEKYRTLNINESASHDFKLPVEDNRLADSRNERHYGGNGNYFSSAGGLLGGSYKSSIIGLLLILLGSIFISRSIDLANNSDRCHQQRGYQTAVLFVVGSFIIFHGGIYALMGQPLAYLELIHVSNVF